MVEARAHARDVEVVEVRPGERGCGGGGEEVADEAGGGGGERGGVVVAGYHVRGDVEADGGADVGG